MRTMAASSLDMIACSSSGATLLNLVLGACFNKASTLTADADGTVSPVAGIVG